MTPADFAFQEIANPAHDLQEDLWERLRVASNARLNQPALAETHSYAVLARDGERLAAGLLAIIYFGGMNLQCLWVDEAERGRGLGARMLQHAEEIARRHGCNLIFGHTFGFQAKGFYLKAGYEEFGALPEYPPGHGCSFLKKTLPALG